MRALILRDTRGKFAADAYCAAKPIGGQAEGARGLYRFIDLAAAFGLLGKEERVRDYGRNLMNNPGDKTRYAIMWDWLPDHRGRISKEGRVLF